MVGQVNYYVLFSCIILINLILILYQLRIGPNAFKIMNYSSIVKMGSFKQNNISLQTDGQSFLLCGTKEKPQLKCSELQAPTSKGKLKAVQSSFISKRHLFCSSSFLPDIPETNCLTLVSMEWHLSNSYRRSDYFLLPSKGFRMNNPIIQNYRATWSAGFYSAWEQTKSMQQKHSCSKES